MSALGHKRTFRSATVTSALCQKRTFRGSICITPLPCVRAQREATHGDQNLAKVAPDQASGVVRLPPLQVQ